MTSKRFLAGGIFLAAWLFASIGAASAQGVSKSRIHCAFPPSSLNYESAK